MLTPATISLTHLNSLTYPQANFGEASFENSLLMGSQLDGAIMNPHSTHDGD